LSDQEIDCHIKVKFEVINNYDIIAVNNDNKGRLNEALHKYPLGREILMIKSQAKIKLPLFTVDHIANLDKTTPFWCCCASSVITHLSVMSNLGCIRVREEKDEDRLLR
jgi:hypothetical protein